MGEFKVEKKSEGDALVLDFQGQIDEDASFEGVELSGNKVILNLENVSAINSCGIREWIKWVRTAPEGCRIIYKNCPKIIVDQVNMVAGFLPENGEIQSFYVPYYAEESGNEKMVLFEKGREFSDGEVHPPEGVKDEESGEEMEMDVIEAKYFKFIKN